MLGGIDDDNCSTSWDEDNGKCLGMLAMPHPQRDRRDDKFISFVIEIIIILIKFVIPASVSCGKEEQAGSFRAQS